MSPTIEVHLDSPFFINQSRWKAYQDCDRYYAWQYLIGLQPATPRKALAFGTAVHHAMEHAHGAGASEEAFKEGIEIALATFRNEMKQPLTGGLIESNEKEVNDGLRMLPKLIRAYYEHYKSLGALWKPLGTELEVNVEVGEGTNVYLVGRIDNLVTYMKGIWLSDYKTMSRLDMRDFLKYQIDVQLTAYIYGGTKQLSLDAAKRGEPPVLIRGAIIDGLVKTDPPQFHRELYTRTIDDLREFEKEFVEKAREIAFKHLRVENGEDWKVVFPKNTSHCFVYGTCPFRDLCVKDTEARRAAYVQRKPDYVDVKKREVITQ